MIRGFDASVIQGSIPWDSLKAAGIKYVSLRCGVGNDAPDSRFAQNYKEAKDHGLIPQAYHFLYPLAHINPVKQAEAHFAAALGCGTNVGELAAAVDLEWPPRETREKDGSIEATWAKWGCTKEQINAWTVKYLARYHELAGVHCVLYIYPYYSQCLAPMDPALAESVLWWASEWKAGVVPVDGNMPCNAIPGLWQKDVLSTPGARGFFWQHDGNGGILMPNGVDADFDVFVGSQEQFDNLTGNQQNVRVDAITTNPILALPSSGGDGSGSS